MDDTPDNREGVITTLKALDNVSWYMAIGAMRGVLRAMGASILPDPTSTDAAVSAIDAEIDRIEHTQGNVR